MPAWLCILFPNISHAWKPARGNIISICENWGYECLLIERGQESFDLEKIIHSVNQRLSNHPTEKTIFISSSFGDIVARELLKKNTIRAHISICGVSDSKEISLMSKILLWVAKKIRPYCYRRKRLRHKIATMFNRKRTPGVSIESIKMNTKCAERWLSKGLSERASFLLQYKEPTLPIKTPAYILYSEDDNNFKNPKHNANRIAHYYEKSFVITLGKAGHSSFVEMPQSYEETISNILHNIW